MDNKLQTHNKYLLSIQEASEYFHIGVNKLRNMANSNKCADWVLWNANHVLIKRCKFEQFIDRTNSI